MNEDSTRLNKHLAYYMGISRRKADELIEGGKITINGKAAELGARIAPDQHIVVNGQPLTDKPTIQVIALNKPVGYVCSRRAQGDIMTIYSLLPQKYHSLKTVGRLDKDSSGIILLTNDGDFAHQMTHPSFQKTKVYTAKLDKPLEPLHQQMISDIGISLEDGPSKFTVSKNDNGTYEITMREGRNRQIRRTFASLGYNVVKLHRTQFGKYSIGKLKPGEYEDLII